MPAIARATTTSRCPAPRNTSPCIRAATARAYAYYLVAICHFDQIIDVGRDQARSDLALSALNEVVARFPESDYARDAELKMDMVRDQLAGKEMEIGRYYLQRERASCGDQPVQEGHHRLPDHDARAGGAAPSGRGLPVDRPRRIRRSRWPPCSGTTIRARSGIPTAMR